jgi:hypothetical protein
MACRTVAWVWFPARQRTSTQAFRRSRRCAGSRSCWRGTTATWVRGSPTPTPEGCEDKRENVELDFKHRASHTSTNDVSNSRTGDTSPALGVVEHDTPEHGLNLLIREARRRQRRRRRAAITGATAILAITIGIAAAERSTRSSMRASLGRETTLGLRGQCPTSPARFASNAVFDATVLGRGVVRLAIGNRYDQARGHVLLGATEAPGWSAIQAISVTALGYDGPFVVRGRRLGTPGTIDVRPANAGLTTGLSPGTGPLSIPSEVDNTRYGFRIYPGSVWVTSSGCYAVQISGHGFNQSIVFDAQTPAR